MPLPWNCLQHKPKKRSSQRQTDSPSARPTEESSQSKRVKFSEEVSCRKIENKSLGAELPLHYSYTDYSRFKSSALEEIRRMKLKYRDLSTKQVISMLYQPVRDHSSLTLFQNRGDLSAINPRPNVIVIPGTTHTQLTGDGTISFIRTAIFLFRKGFSPQPLPEAALPPTSMGYI